jgi:hypothetical protein
MFVHRFKLLPLAVFLPSLIVLSGCEVLVPRDTKSLLVPSLQRSEVVGVVAGFGTTFAAMPDLVDPRGEPEGELCCVFAITEPCSQLIGTAMERDSSW